MSTPAPPAAPSPRRDKPVNRWHRNAGVAAAGVLVYLLITGVPLQFSAELGLGQRHVSAAWILDWYGLHAPDLVVQSGEVIQVGQQLYFGDQVVATMGSLAGAVSIADFVVAAGSDELLVFPRAGAAVTETTRIPGPIKRIGSWRGTPYLDTAEGLLAADALLINWHGAVAPPGAIDWAETSELTEASAAAYRSRYRSRMLTTERWLQDLHSGRFFGTLGVLVIDLTSALLLILAGTGLVLWWRYRNSSS